MRRKVLLLAGLPATIAISLANFEPLDSSQIPYTCEVPYYNQIPSCLVSDFSDGCSGVCEQALEAVAQSVIRACQGVTADPNSLLEAVLMGGIIAAVCPAEPSDTTTSSSHRHHTTSTDIVTEPQNGPGVTHTQTAGATTVTSTSSITTTDQPTPPPIIGAPPTNQPSSSDFAPATTSSSSATPTQTPAPQGKPGGGGDPFDLTGQNTGGASLIGGGSVLALIIAACACMILG
jgi:hypothetical protein